MCDQGRGLIKVSQFLKLNRMLILCKACKERVRKGKGICVDYLLVGDL